MSETPNDLEQEVEDLIHARFAQPSGDEQEAAQEDEQGTQKHIDVDLYRLEGGAVLLVPNNGTNLLEENTVESGAHTQEDQEASPAEVPIMPSAEEEMQEAYAQEPEPAPSEKLRGTRRRVLFVPLALLCILAVGAASYFYLAPLTASATVTITPKTRTLQADTTLTITANPQAGQVQGRPLEAIRFTGSKTVPATGQGHDQATQATGIITFYNAD